MQRLRRAGAMALRAGLVMLIVAWSAIFIALVYLQTAAGHAWLLAFALAQARQVVPGLEVERLEGDYFHRLALVGVTVKDAENQPALRAQAVRVTLAPFALLGKTVHVRRLEVQGAELSVRRLRDGRDSLATVVTPPPPAPPPPAEASALPLAIVVDLLCVRGAVQIAGAEGPALEVSGVAIDAHGQWGADRRVVIERAEASLSAPLAMHVRVEGDAELSAGGVDATLRGRVVTGEGGDSAERALSLALTARGPLERIGVSLTATLAPSDAASRGPAPEHRPRAEPARLALWGFIGLPDGGSFTYDLYTRGEHLDPHVLAPALPASDINVEAWAQGQGVPLTAKSAAQATLLADRSRVQDFSIEAVRLQAHTDQEDWWLEEGAVRGFGGLITLRGRGTDRSVWAALKATSAPSRELPPALGAMSWRGDADLRVWGFLPRALKARGVVNLRAIEAPPIRVASAALVIDAALARTVSGRATLRVRKIGRSEGGALVDRLDVDATLGSRFSDLRAEALLAGAPKPLTIKARVPVVFAGALPALSRDRNADVQLAWRGFSLAALDTLFSDQRLGLSGELSVDATLSGPLKSPRVGAEIALARFAYRGAKAVDARVGFTSDARATALEAQVDWRARRVLDLRAASDLGLGKILDKAFSGGAPAAARSTALLDAPLAISAKVINFDTAELRLLGPDLPRMRGVANLTLTASGSARAPALKLAATLDNGRWHRLRLDAVTLSLESAARKDGLRLGGSFDVNGRPLIVVGGEVGINVGAELAGGAPDPTLDVKVAIPAFALEALAQIIPGWKNTHGVMSAEARVRGTAGAPAIAATARLSGAQLAGEPLGDAHLDAHFDAARGADAAVQVTQPDGGRLAAKVRLAAPVGRAALDASLTADGFDIRFARLFSPALRETAGTLDAAITASGVVPKLAVSGKASLRDGRLGLQGFSTFTDIALALTLSADRVTLERLTLGSGHGTLTAKGALTLADLAPRRLTLEGSAKKFLLAFGGISDATFDGQIEVGADLTRGIDGQARIKDGVINVPQLKAARQLQAVGPLPDVVFVENGEVVRGPLNRPSAKAGGAPIRFKIVADPLFVRGKEIDVEAYSDLTYLTDDEGAGVLEGTIGIRRGHVEIFSRQYEVDEARLLFAGGEAINPGLRVTITRQFPQALVHASVFGTLKNPDLELRSDPPVYDKAQILSLIVTGQASLNDKGGGGSTSQTVTNAVIGSVLSAVADKLAPAVGLDVLKVDVGAKPENTTDQTQSAKTSSRVELGKYLTERLYVAYQRVIGATEGQNANEAKLEYRISPKLTLQSRFGDKGVGGVDFFWSYHY